MTKEADQVTSALLMQRHSYFLEAAVAALLQVWRSHFERVPVNTAECKHVLVALGSLGSGETPRDARRIQALPASLLEPTQLAAISSEIEAVHQEVTAHLGGVSAPAAKG